MRVDRAMALEWKHPVFIGSNQTHGADQRLPAIARGKVHCVGIVAIRFQSVAIRIGGKKAALLAIDSKSLPGNFLEPRRRDGGNAQLLESKRAAPAPAAPMPRPDSRSQGRGIGMRCRNGWVDGATIVQRLALGNQRSLARRILSSRPERQAGSGTARKNEKPAGAGFRAMRMMPRAADQMPMQTM